MNVDNKAVFKNIPFNLPSTAFSCMVLGSRGSGKTQLIKKILDIYTPQINIDNRYLISPTAYLDNTLSDFFDKDNVFTIYNDQIIEFIEDVIKTNMDKQKQEIYKKTLQELEMDDDKFIEAEIKEMIDKKYALNLKRLYKPDHNLLIVEDSLGLFRPKSKLSFLFTRHRWYNLSVIISSQSFRVVPPVIRNNCVLNFMFPTNNKELKKLEEEFNNYKKDESFKKMFEKYVYNYNTLFVNRSLPKTKQYHQNLDRYIDMSEFEK
jgi:hypothetical protein